MTLYLSQVKTQLQKVLHVQNQQEIHYQILHQTHLSLILIKTQRASQVPLQVLFQLPFQAQNQAQVQNQVKLQVQTPLQKVTLSATRFLFQIQNVVLTQSQFPLPFQTLYLNLRVYLFLFQLQIQTLPQAQIRVVSHCQILQVFLPRLQNQVVIQKVTQHRYLLQQVVHFQHQ